MAIILLGAGFFVTVIVWYLIRLLLRLMIDITMSIFQQYEYIFILGVGLLFFSLWNSMVGRKPLVRIWPMVLGILVMLFGYWGYLFVEMPVEMVGQYVRNDHKAQLIIDKDSIHIWSAKKHLSGRYEILPYFSYTVAKARISGLPSNGTKSGMFSMSIEDMYGETIYRLEPTADSLLIYTDDGTTIHYGRKKQ
jgi:hypothetical protein